jgi:hypothetical protein
MTSFVKEANAMPKISEDWLAVIVGGLLILAVFAGVIQTVSW